jgi:tetratricopeptide (TPR) repeat protein
METRPELAAKDLLQALGEDPDSAYVHGLLGTCLLDSGDLEGAYREARETIRLGPDYPFGFYLLARCELDSDKLMEAEVAIEEAIELDPTDPLYYGLLANIQIVQNELELALESTERGLEMDAEHVHCHNLRAYILTKLKRSEDEAAHSMKTAIDADPENAITHAYRGWTLLEHHKHEESIGHFRESLRLDPTLQWARLGMLRALQVKHWAFQLHLKLKNKLSGLAIILWFAGNFYLHGLTSQIPEQWHGGFNLLIAASWLALVGFCMIVFLPHSIISDPIIKFMLQFDHDGRLVLLPEEKKFNTHFVGFLAAIVFMIPIGFLTQAWWPISACIGLYIITLPFTDKPENRTLKRWLFHIAVGVGVFSVCLFMSAPRLGMMVVRTALWINLIKIIAGGKLLKALLGALGLGAVATAARLKEKKQLREKMMKDARIPGDSKKK